MAPRSLRPSFSAPPARRPRPAKFGRLKCEQLEGRIAPALFNVQGAVTPGAANANYGSIATGDFNGDGNTDIVMTNYGTAPPGASPPNNAGGNTISILLGTGTGTFGSANNITVGTNQYVSFVAVGDLNGDGKQDLAVVSSNEDSTGVLRIYLGNGSGGFTLSSQGAISTGSSNATWVGIAQVTNGDTNPDVVVAGFGDSDQGHTTVFGNNITVFQGDGTGAVSLINTVTNGLSFIPTALALADFNGDGSMDIAATVPGVPPDATSPQPTGTVQLFNGNGAGGFTAGNSFSSGGALPISIKAAYLNGDTLPDLVIANAGDPDAANTYQNFGLNSAIGVAINAGGGNFNISTLTAGLGVSGSKSVFAVTVADFDLDGKMDIAGIVYGDPLSGANARVLEYKGDGNGGFAADANSPYNTLATGGQYLAAAPLDANNTPDIVYGTDGGKYGVLLNTSTPAVSTTTDLSSSANPSTSGQSVTFTATVTAASGTASGGTVTFFNNGNAIGSPVNLASQQAAVTTSTLTVGTHSITATYSGAAGFAGSPSNVVSQGVNAAGPAPTVTINQGGAPQLDPTNSSPIAFAVHFDQAVTGFDGSDILFTGTVGGTLVAGVSGASPGQDYTVTVTGMTGTGTVVASVKAGAAVNGASTPSAASTSTDNTVTFDGISPSVTIDQAAGQSDPSNVASVKFAVKFSEPVTGFGPADVSLAGSTAGGTLSIAVTGSLDTYTVTVTGMTTRGFVIASIPAGGASDAVGNLNVASTSTDNSVEFVNTGTLGFTQAVYNTTEDATTHTVTITVTRAVQTDGAVSISYGTSDGTAHSGGSVLRGQADYTPTSGTLSWADGEGGDKTFTIPILPDALNEGKELINLALSNPVGSPVLGLTAATVAIAPNDGQGPGVYFDQDGDKVTIKLNGKTGSMLFFRTDPDGDNRGPIELIVLTGTLPDPLKPKATLVISVAKAKTSTDGGTIGLGAITGTGLKSISARKANLNMEGINLTGYLGALTIGNVVDGADITTLATTNPKQKTRINALAIGDGTAIDVGANVSSLTATSFGAGSFKAPSVGTITIKGNMAADVNITGVGVDPTKKALGAMRVKGVVAGSDITVNGNVGSVVVGAFRNSRLFAGYTGPDDGTGSFNTPATVTSFKATGKFDGFENSVVIATAVNTAFLRSVDSTNGGVPLGFIVKNALGHLTIGSPPMFTYRPADGALKVLDDFVVEVV